MQCVETISHMVTAGRSNIHTWRNTCVTAGKTTVAVDKINYGWFEMLSGPHRTSNHIMHICFRLLETCTKCSFFIEENIRPSTQQLAFEVKYEYIVHRSTNTLCASGLRLGNFQTTGAWCVNAQLFATEPKCAFYHLKSVDCQRSYLWNSFGLFANENNNWLDFVGC